MILKSAKAILATIVLAGTVVAGIGSKPAQADAASAASFSDVKGHWAEGGIQKALDKGIVSGFPDGTFRPDDVVTGDQFITMMLKTFSKPDSSGNLQFDPVWMDELSNTHPARYNTIKNAVGSTGYNFQNASSGYWAAAGIDFLYSMEFLTANNPVFPKKYDNFKKEITREKASYLLGEWLVSFEDRFDAQYEDYVLAHSGMRDMGDFSSTPASTHRATVLMAGLMRGWDNKFWPQRYVTRAEALTMVLRLKDKTARDPYIPNMTGQAYTTVDGKIYMFSDKAKLDVYNKIVKLASDTVKSGYVDRNGKGVGIWDSKDSLDKAVFLASNGRADEITVSSEVALSVASGTANYISFDYAVGGTFEHSQAFYAGALDLMVGKGHGSELKDKLTNMESSLTADAQTFTLNGKTFAVYTTGKRVIVQTKY